ncbi:zinc-dependent alcohol dehydrogenase family protein [Allomesorhizobium camelthorni]|uniref:Zinc-dependent alcohol dehydrogenase family protein n=1 Tax=Allomesorhizobium camelthorni TaxID=475069 RepID=A0A6G4W9W4_9HYPH|nr:zinc-dependent alcohol dehydrogenase family protein [Mesorhizobium camelthorni]NGO51364.1 zinc-dependent alcohol dehydrogenase family protein [Mesorhizobium camelthorni]
MPRAWRIHDYSGYHGLNLEEEPWEEPGAGEIRLRVEAFALNWGDMDLMKDNYSFSFPEFPARVGIEAAGVIDAIGSGVAGFEIGERVSTLPYFYDNRGASTESLVIDSRYVAKAPPNLSPIECASIWMQYLTAYFPLAEVSKVGPASHVLVTAATSTAGSASLQIGRALGATMIGTTRFAGNAGYLLQMGADHVIVTDENDLTDQIVEMTGGKGVDMVFDPVGAGLVPRYSPALAKNARIYFYGTLDTVWPDLPFVDMFQKNAVFHPYSVFNYVEDAAMCAKGLAALYDMLAKGIIRPRIDRVYPMEKYVEAFDYLSQPRKHHGKVVIETGL